MVKLRVNGQEQSFDGDPSMPLLWFLRDELGLTGTKYGCGVALCGACTVQVDGVPILSCTAVAGSYQCDNGNHEITTVEGVAEHGAG